jgi:hypothetical protein
MQVLEEDHLNEAINFNNLTTLVSEYPSDKSNFSETLTAADKTLNINAGPCRTNASFPKNSTRCGFSNKFYERTSKQVQKCREHGFAFLLNLTSVIVSHISYFLVLKTKCLLVLMIGAI